MRVVNSLMWSGDKKSGWMSITYVDALLGQKRMRVHSVKKLFIRIHSCRLKFVTEEQEMTFSHSAVLFWTGVRHSNYSATTRYKCQKEQWEIFFECGRGEFQTISVLLLWTQVKNVFSKLPGIYSDCFFIYKSAKWLKPCEWEPLRSFFKTDAPSSQHKPSWQSVYINCASPQLYSWWTDIIM